LIIPRAEHGISRRQISDSALKVLYRLNQAGYRGCLVGGGVRDLLLGVQPKDFDVATDASPEEIRELFSNSRLIGRRFRLAHVRFGREIIEVSTFRADMSGDESPDEEDDRRAMDDAGRILRDNVYGSIEEDARRRDFTVNALYYDIADFGIHDYVGGMADIEQRQLRLMGDPETRYREDPVRMLRALRIAAKLDLEIEPATLDPIPRMAGLLADVPAARMFDEVLKALMNPDGPAAFETVYEYGLLDVLFPATGAALKHDSAGLMIIRRAIANTAQRIRDDRPVTPAFLYAAFLWPGVQALAARFQEEGRPPAQALAMAQRDILGEQVQRVSLPKRFAVPMREIWQLQPRFHKQRGKQPARLMSHPRFRAAYDFLLLRAEAGEVDQATADFWTQAQEATDSPAPAPSRPGSAGRRRRRRRRGGQGGGG
jgi:poly(A) polymerase